jgi:VIT1/CCC1 family predicted Fe2+/Mn2+ transporter
MATTASAGRGQRDRRSFLLQRAQPAMVGLIDGSLSTLAPIFAVALATRQPRDAFLAGLATAIGAILHTLPFLISQYRSALLLALVVIAFELLALAWIRRRFFGAGFLSSFVSVTLGGAVIAAISAALGAAR